MSSTTTIRLSDEMKARLAKAARRGSTTARGFIVEEIDTVFVLAIRSRREAGYGRPADDD